MISLPNSLYGQVTLVEIRHLQYSDGYQSLAVMTHFLDRIEMNPRVLLGKPVIRGTRIPVALILSLLAKGYTVERIVAAYPNLARADVIAAIRYSGARMDRERMVRIGAAR